MMFSIVRLAESLTYGDAEGQWRSIEVSCPGHGGSKDREQVLAC